MQGEMYLKKLEELQKMISGMIADEKGGMSDGQEMMEGQEEPSELVEEVDESEDMMGEKPEMSDDDLMEYLKPKEKKKPGKGTLAIAVGFKGGKK